MLGIDFFPMYKVVVKVINDISCNFTFPLPTAFCHNEIKLYNIGLHCILKHILSYMTAPLK